MHPDTAAAAILESLQGLDGAGIEVALGQPGHSAWPLVDRLAAAADSEDEAERRAGLGALFAGLVEPLNDSFSTRLRLAYGILFSRVVWHACQRREPLRRALAEAGIASQAGLLARWRRVREGSCRPPAQARTVVLLSRVTVGADILLGTVALQRLRQRYPSAEILVLGDGKLSGLVGGFPGVRVRPLAYPRRGPLGERLGGWLALRSAVDEEAPDLVVAPDSRLDQLGILPVGREDRYLLWENTLPEGGPAVSLAELLDERLAATLGLPPSPPMLPRLALAGPAVASLGALRAALGPGPLVGVKLDHGGNPAKALPREGELLILRTLRDRGWRILIDRGFGEEELAASQALMEALGARPCDLDDSGRGLGLDPASLAPGALADQPLLRFHGSIAGWAAALSLCRLAFSYDSVGHHLAAALGVPVLVAFTGHAHPAFPVAWQPRGPGRATVLVIPSAEVGDARQWQRVATALPAAP